MIISKTVDLTIKSKRPLGFWRKNGFPGLKLGETISVSLDSLPFHTRIQVLYRCDSCGKEKLAMYGNVSQKPTHLCHDCSQSNKCSHMNKTRPKDYFPKGKEHWNWNPNRQVSRDFYYYAKRVRRITEETYSKYKDRLNPNNHPRTRCGVEGGYQLDHKISVKWGFLHGLNPKIVGSLDNLQMLPWKHNLLKGE